MIVPQVAKMLARPHHKGPQTGDLGSMSGAKWDMKHGLGKRGTDFGVSDGATHGGASLAHKQIKERIFELFGKTDHSDDKRRMGIPTHFDQLQGLLKNLKGAVGGDLAGATETEVKKDIIKALHLANIDIPPLGLVLPNISTVWIFFRHNGNVTAYGKIFGESDLAKNYTEWKLSGAELGDFRKAFGVYKAWPYYKDIAPPSVTGADAHYTVVGNFFGSGLQWDS
jgi:hypothetical protein